MIGVRHYCHIDMQLYTDADRASAGVVRIPPHIKTSREQEVQGYKIITKYIRDGANQSFRFHISDETGIYHIYFSDKRIEYVEEFGFLYKSVNDPFFVRGIQLIASEMKQCLGLKVSSEDMKDTSTVPRTLTWETIEYNRPSRKFTSYHSHRCKILITMTSDKITQTCKTCRKDLK